MSERELLDEQVICQSGSWQRVRRWWKGIHPEVGTIVQGWSGWETVEERDRVRAVSTFVVHATLAHEQTAAARAA